MIDIKCTLGLVIGFFLTASALALPADQFAKYHIRVLGMTVGELTVTQKTMDEGAISIEAVTDVEVKLIFTYRVKYIQHSSYRDGYLQKYHIQTLKNGKMNSDTRLEKTGDAYLLIKDGDSTYVHDEITYSGSLLYFNEPRDIPHIYNERKGENKPINSIDKHTYIITDEKDRKTNEYQYEGGILDLATLIHPLATIRLERFL